MRALVLSGGGARGAYEAGVASVLARSQVYDVISGASIGAINAAFVASGRADRLESFWQDTLPSRVPKLLPHIPKLRHMLADFNALGNGSRWSDARRLIHALSDMRFLNLFRERRGPLPPRIAALARELGTFLDLSAIRCRLMIAATNVTLGVPAIFYANGDGMPIRRVDDSAETSEWRALQAEQFALSVLASAALPGLMAPITLKFEDGVRSYGDGGLVHNSPIALAIDAGATDLTVVFVDPVSDAACSCPEHGVGHLICAVFVMLQQRMLDYELRLVEATNALIRNGSLAGRREIRVRCLRPEEPLEIDILGFDDTRGVAHAFRLGALDAQRSLDARKASLV